MCHPRRAICHPERSRGIRFLDRRRDQRPRTDPSTMVGMTNTLGMTNGMDDLTFERRTRNAEPQNAERQNAEQGTHIAFCHPRRAICHPERHLSSERSFVIPSAVEGSASSTVAATAPEDGSLHDGRDDKTVWMTSRLNAETQNGERRAAERRTPNGECTSLFVIPKGHLSSRAPFVIPSAVEGSASSTVAATTPEDGSLHDGRDDKYVRDDKRYG
jgi:hypothetical protein